MELNKEQKEIIAALKAEQKELNRKTNVLENKIAESEQKVKKLTKVRNLWARICTGTSVVMAGACLTTYVLVNNYLQDSKALATVGLAECVVGAVATASTLWKTLSADEKQKQEKAKLKELKHTKYLRDLL